MYIYRDPYLKKGGGGLFFKTLYRLAWDPLGAPRAACDILSHVSLCHTVKPWRLRHIVAPRLIT